MKVLVTVYAFLATILVTQAQFYQIPALNRSDLIVLILNRTNGVNPALNETQWNHPALNKTDLINSVLNKTQGNTQALNGTQWNQPGLDKTQLINQALNGTQWNQPALNKTDLIDLVLNRTQGDSQALNGIQWNRPDFDRTQLINQALNRTQENSSALNGTQWTLPDLDQNRTLWLAPGLSPWHPFHPYNPLWALGKNKSWNNNTWNYTTPSGDIIQGQIGYQDRLLFNQIYFKDSRWWSGREKTIEYPNVLPDKHYRHETISAIRIYNKFYGGLHSKAEIVKGGVGSRYAKIRMSSDWGKGFKYLVQIFGR